MYSHNYNFIMNIWIQMKLFLVESLKDIKNSEFTGWWRDDVKESRKHLLSVSGMTLHIHDQNSKKQTKNKLSEQLSTTNV